jgi:hypothetical protein
MLVAAAMEKLRVDQVAGRHTGGDWSGTPPTSGTDARLESVRGL